MKWEETGKPAGVSLCMTTKNEETNPAGGIGAFLTHHLPIVDEVVLVDTGSTDRTIQIAKGFDRVQTHQYKWDGSFSNARNFSLEQARYDHVLVLDADEKLLHTGVPIREILPTRKGELFGYEFVFIDINPKGVPALKTNHPDMWLGNYEHRVRYFMNLPCLRFGGVVHEQLRDVSDVCIVDFVISHATAGLVVNHYLPSQELLEQKAQFYESLARAGRR